MRAKIKEKKEIAEGTLLVKFDLQGQETSFKPGQFFFVTLINPEYTDSKGNERHFSIINSPNEKGVLTMATRIRESSFKQNLLKMPLKTEVEIGMISGSFSLPIDQSKRVVFIAGGIGIAPFMSMLRYVDEENLGYKITLLYSNRRKESTAFLKELKSLEQKNPNFKLVLTMTDDPNWEGEKGRIGSGFIRKHVSDFESSNYLIAGAPMMVKAMFEAVSEIGVDNDSIYMDNFIGY